MKYRAIIAAWFSSFFANAFVRRRLNLTSAMEAGAAHVWSIDEIVGLLR
jgi:hypothetical protein